MEQKIEFDFKKNKRKALLVGVDDYASPGGPDLNGCVNDVRDMAHTLNVLNIVPARPGNMRILTNSRATRSNILKGLEWLIDDSKPGDFLIFTFLYYNFNRWYIIFFQSHFFNPFGNFRQLTGIHIVCL